MSAKTLANPLCQATIRKKQVKNVSLKDILTISHDTIGMLPTPSWAKKITDYNMPAEVDLVIRSERP